MWEYNYSNELYHHGVLGMKWGHRKAANSASDNSSPKHTKKRNYSKAFEPSMKAGKDKEKISPVEKSLKETGRMVDNAKDVSQSISNIKSAKHPTVSKAKTMSDQELKSAISRMELERRYDSLSSNDTSKGKSYVMDVLGVVGGVVGIGASAAAIASTIYNISHSDINFDELYHHGVKGMKWGVRQSLKQTGSSNRTKSGKVSNNPKDWDTNISKSASKYLKKKDYDNIKKAIDLHNSTKDHGQAIDRDLKIPNLDGIGNGTSSKGHFTSYQFSKSTSDNYLMYDCHILDDGKVSINAYTEDDE